MLNGKKLKFCHGEVRLWKSTEGAEIHRLIKIPLLYAYILRDVEKFKLCLEQNLDKAMVNLSHNMQALEIVFKVLHSSVKTETKEGKQKEIT